MRWVCIMAVGFVMLGAHALSAAEYRIVPSSLDATAGMVVNLMVEVETEPGDNLVGFGHFSFAIDLALGGTAGAMGGDIGGVTINEVFFDDALSNRTGMADGSNYTGAAGVTTDADAPNEGSMVGDVVLLFTFTLTVPPTAVEGDTITLMSSQGLLENVTVNDDLDLVSPQNFAGATIHVVPEPATGMFALIVGLLAMGRRRLATPA